MESVQDKNKYDLEERTFHFAKNCRNFLKITQRSISNDTYGKQLLRSSSSVAANYIEANEAISKKDFSHRIKICRKEAKESRLWIRLLTIDAASMLETKRTQLAQEALELIKIFGSIVEKVNSFKIVT